MKMGAFSKNKFSEIGLSPSKGLSFSKDQLSHKLSRKIQNLPSNPPIMFNSWKSKIRSQCFLELTRPNL